MPLVEKEPTHREDLSSLVSVFVLLLRVPVVDTVYPPRAPEFTPEVSGFALLLTSREGTATHPEYEFTPDSGPQFLLTTTGAHVVVRRNCLPIQQQMISLLMLVGG